MGGDRLLGTKRTNDFMIILLAYQYYSSVTLRVISNVFGVSLDPRVTQGTFCRICQF